MDGLQFISDTVGHVAWPLAFGWLAWRNRDSITRLLDRLQSAKAPGFEANFEQARKLAENALPEQSKSEQSNPKETVLRSWAEVESLLDNLITKAPDRSGRTFSSAQEKVDFLTDRKILNEVQGNAVNGLLVLRNMATDAPNYEVTPQRAKEFLAIASANLYFLRQIK